jgi:hypothetical protein
MTTATEIIEDALSDILVRASESPIPADEMQSAIRVLNRMTSSWNLDIGYTEVKNAGDVLTIIEGAELAIQKNLSVLLAPQFDAIAGMELKAQARGSLKDLKKIIIKVGNANYPTILPLGSGNTRFYNTPTFYPAAPTVFATNALLDFTNNSTETVISTINTAVLVAGTWVNQHSARMTVTPTGRVTFNPTSSEDLSVTVSATLLTASGNNQITLQIAKNGVLIANAAASVTGSATTSRDIEISWNDSFDTGDYIELFAINETDTANLTITSATLRVG